MLDKDVVKRSVVHVPEVNEATTMTMFISSASSNIPDWGTDWITRDRMLREFWPNEPYLASAIYSIAATRASFSWQLDGPPKTVKQVHDMLHNSQMGKGWINLKFLIAIDLLTQDNGAFVEVIRKRPVQNKKPWEMPVIGLVHLDAGRCVRTGNPQVPAIYTDEKGGIHRLKWYEVITFEEMPSPIEQARGRQVCFLSRVLRAAEIVKEINKYKYEKVSGRFSRAVHLVGGVAQHEIDNSQRKGQLDADNAGLYRYMQPIILASLDPNAKVSHVQIDLATLPDAFNEDETLKWYISLLAMASGGDYQDLAPLPGGNMGTASQSETLHKKSRIKGNALWMKLFEHKLQFNRIIPTNVSFKFLQQDSGAEAEMVEIANRRAETRKTQIETGEITAEVARKIAVDVGDLKQEYLVMMGQPDPQVITVQDDQTINEAAKSVGIGVAHKASAYIRRLIEEHPVQGISPISEGKLDTFQTNLRNYITKEISIGTDSGWQDFILTKAAYESGIHPHTLRHRLPDNYHLYVHADSVMDSRGSVIYQKPIKRAEVSDVRVAKGAVCQYCNNPKEVYVWLPFTGWKAVCNNHIQGLIGRKDSVQYNLSELLDEFRKQFIDISTKGRYNKLGLYASALTYAYKLAINREFNQQDINILKADIARQAEAIDHVFPEILCLGIQNLYLKAKTKLI
jgi:hypothetical protein